MTLNFFTATKAHQDWKKRLLQCVCDNCNDNLDPERIAKDNLCALGMWLYERKAGPGRRHGNGRKTRCTGNHRDTVPGTPARAGRG
jgi:hypothetical protein